MISKVLRGIAIKKLLCGFAFILFGIAMFLAEIAGFFIPIIDVGFWDYIGFISAVVGLVVVIREAWRKSE